jgi:hypothetical protein
MARGIFNLVIGGVMIIGGLSGNLVLKGTSSGGALALIGVFLAGLGIYRMTQSKA